MNGGQFYTDQATELIIDTQFPHPVPPQNMLLDSLRRCNDLVQRDMRYAHLVAGASKMPMNMIWAARNQDELVNDTDLAKLKDVVWNDFIQKRFIPALNGGQSFANTASSMLEIVREMNLQRRRFQIMGLHEQVEASEIQLVLHLCQARILHPSTNTQGEYRSLANRFRRHDRFYEAFALAVGAFVCSSAPFTLGAATTRYERDLQYEYKKHTTALFVYVLQQHPGALSEAAVFDEDYVLRISRLIVVWPGGDGGGGGRGPGCGSGDDGSLPPVPPPSLGERSENDRARDEAAREVLMGAVAAAQTMAEKAEFAVGKMGKEMNGRLNTSIAVMKEGIESVKELQRTFERTQTTNFIDWLMAGRPGGGGGGNNDTDSQLKYPGLTALLDQLKTDVTADIDTKLQTAIQKARESLEEAETSMEKNFDHKLQTAISEEQRRVDGVIQRNAGLTTAETTRQVEDMKKRMETEIKNKISLEIKEWLDEEIKLHDLMQTFSGYNGRISILEQRTDALAKANNAITASLQVVDAKAANINTTLDSYAQQFDSMDSRITAVETSTQSFPDHLQQLRKLLPPSPTGDAMQGTDEIDPENRKTWYDRITEHLEHVDSELNSNSDRLDEIGGEVTASKNTIQDLIDWTGYDASDYTKNIPHQLEAFETALHDINSTKEVDYEDGGGRENKRPRREAPETPQQQTVDGILENERFEERLIEMVAAAMANQQTLYTYPPPPPPVGSDDTTLPNDVHHRLEQLEQTVRGMQNMPPPAYDQRSASTMQNARFSPSS